MSLAANTTVPFPPKPSNPFETARLALVKRLLEIKVPVAMPAFPTPGHFHGVADHIRQAAEIFDGWLASVGHEVRDNATTSIDADSFEGAFVGAVDGNALYACESAAEALTDSRRNIRRAG